MAVRKAARRRLSVAMIVRDEANVLADSIQSVRTIADEVVVFDTGSTDRTPDIARKLGAIVTRGAWTNDFSAARNRAMALSTGQWILWLDGGERLDLGTAAALREFVDEDANPETAYLMMVEIPPPEKGNSSEQAGRIRLVPNNPLLRFEGRVRETLRPSLHAAGFEIGQAPGRIIRHLREHDPEHKRRRAEQDLHLVTLEAEQLGHYPTRLLLALGAAYADLGSPQSARDAFLQTLGQCPGGSHEMLEAYYGLLASMDPQVDRAIELSTCLEALEAFPLDGQLLMAMANCMQAQGRHDLAGRAFELAIKHGQVDLETWHLSELAEVAASCLSLALRLQGKEVEAQRELEEALTLHPSSARLRAELLDLLVRRGLCEEALRLFEQLDVEPARCAGMREAVRGAAAAARGEWSAALGHLQIAYVGGCTDAFCLRWLATALLSNGQIEAAEPVLRHWQRIEPASAEMKAYLAMVVPEECTSSAASAAPRAEQPPRRIRVDPPQVVLALPISPPIVTQATSADRQ